jgi:hypothetical protein
VKRIVFRSIPLAATPRANNLALVEVAEVPVSSEEDLLVLDPWREVRVLRPADLLIRSRES